MNRADPIAPRLGAWRPWARWCRFWRSARGSLSVEAVFILPILIWAYAGTFVFYDAFRTQRVNITATNTIADLISRQIAPVDAELIEGMHEIYDSIAQARNQTTLRVTSLYWNVNRERYEVIWSHGTRGNQRLNHGRLNQLADRLPGIPRGDTLILVQATMDYTPPMPIGIAAQTFDHLVFIRPRFAPQIIFEDGQGSEIGLTPCQQGQVNCGW